MMDVKLGKLIKLLSLVRKRLSLVKVAQAQGSPGVLKKGEKNILQVRQDTNSNMVFMFTVSQREVRRVSYLKWYTVTTVWWLGSIENYITIC